MKQYTFKCSLPDGVDFNKNPKYKIEERTQLGTDEHGARCMLESMLQCAFTGSTVNECTNPDVVA
jgi:hypothetical protein